MCQELQFCHCEEGLRFTTRIGEAIRPEPALSRCPERSEEAANGRLSRKFAFAKLMVPGVERLVSSLDDSRGAGD